MLHSLIKKQNAFYSIITFSYCIFFYLYSLFTEHNNFVLLDSWKYAMYAINYNDYGFVKRGFIGTLFKNIFGTFSIQAVNCLFALQLLLAILLTIYFLHKIRDKFNSSKSYLVFSLIILLSPATFSHFVFDFGRLDLTITLVFLLQFYLYKKNLLIISSIVSCIGILTHEIYIIIFTFPLLIFVLHENNHRKDTFLSLFKLMTLPAITTLLLYCFGKYEPGLNILVAHLNTDIGLDWNYFDSAKVWTRSLSDNISMGMDNLKSLRKLFYLFMMSFYLLGTFLYFIVLSVKNGFKISIVYITPFFPLVLIFLGIDNSRWFSFSNILLYMLFVWTMFEEKGKKIQQPFLGCSICILVLNLVLGPYGVIDSFFWAQKGLNNFLLFIHYP